MSVLVEGPRSLWLGAQAFLVENDNEIAWAEKHVVKHPSLRYILGRYAESARANLNGHVFDQKELEAATKLLPDTPVNMLHRQHYIVGHYVAAEMVYPMGNVVANVATEPLNPHMEALSAFYRYYFPDEFKMVEQAHKEGSLFYSMECVPRSLTCAGTDGCGQEFAYDGRQSPTYCAHLNEHATPRKLNSPNFTGGALVIPPAKPGWKRADITEMSKLLAAHAEEAHAIYGEVAKQLPTLAVVEWEATVGELLRLAYAQTEGEAARAFSPGKRKILAIQKKALPDGSYPIETEEDLGNAIKAFGRAKPAEKAKVKAHIKARAAALGATKKLPPDWK